jgi:hypothetical protein
MVLDRRDEIIYGDGFGYYYSPKEVAIKWAVVGGIFLLTLGFLLFSYIHATRRLKKGIAPLRYHRWLLSRRQRSLHEPQFAQQDFVYQMAPPPYNPNYPMPPTYQPPQGGSKINPTQSFYGNPPPGPPPGRRASPEPVPSVPAPEPARVNNTGSSGRTNPFL